MARPAPTTLAMLALSTASACGVAEIDNRVSCSAAEPCPGAMTCGADGFCGLGADGGGTIDLLPDGGPPAPVTTIQLEAEDYDRSEGLDGVHAWDLDTNRAGYSGAGFVIVMPDVETACLEIPVGACGAHLSYDVDVEQAGDYYIHAPTQATKAENDSLVYGVDGGYVAPHNVASDGAWGWSTGTSRIALTAGAHSLEIWMREDGVRIDLVALSLDP
jgi:hypothetical protein